MQHLKQKAKEILSNNWRNGFTIPTAKLYPFQWNWDSGFCAMGFTHFNLKHAIAELDSLFKGQWENGMLPHILFHSENEKSYFPNFEVWNSPINPGAPKKLKTSGITQPPVHGFALEYILSHHVDNKDLIEFVKNLYPKIIAYHKFLYTHRDPKNEKLFAIYHPWESGRDNSPIWDDALNNIKINEHNKPTYERRDTQIANADERPTAFQYDRYVYLLELGRKHKYEGADLLSDTPFLIQDCMMNAILIKSNKSLLNIAEKLNLDKGNLQEWIAEGEKNFEKKFWNTTENYYFNYDLKKEEQIKLKDIGGLIPLYAKIPNQEKANALIAYIQNLHDTNFFLCPSFDTKHNLFDSKRYWRGPIWPHMNYMLYHGLINYGSNNIAEIVKSDTLKLIEELGFYEYFESQKALIQDVKSGYGGNNFSWTSAIVINFLKENKIE